MSRSDYYKRRNQAFANYRTESGDVLANNPHLNAQARRQRSDGDIRGPDTPPRSTLAPNHAAAFQPKLRAASPQARPAQIGHSHGQFNTYNAASAHQRAHQEATQAHRNASKHHINSLRNVDPVAAAHRAHALGGQAHGADMHNTGHRLNNIGHKIQTTPRYNPMHDVHTIPHTIHHGW
jgi:hypothetical protein